MTDENAINTAMGDSQPAAADTPTESVTPSEVVASNTPTTEDDTVPMDERTTPPQWWLDAQRDDEQRRNVMRPDAVAMPDGSTVTDEPWQALNPCPLCQSTPHDAPEGTNLDGSPRWVFPNCWKCGYRPKDERNFQTLGGNVPALAGADTATIDRLIAALQVARDSAPR